jgi:indolepyruvate ferredoxin oxidoreductase beta subunit
MKDEIKNVLIAGVGGQGVLLISEIFAEVCMDAGYDVKKSEVHGMAQRGGSVVSHVRYGTKVYSPLIEMGTAHVLLALEELEALRWVNYLHPDAVVIVNRQQIKPLPVAVGLQTYPKGVLAKLSKAARVVVIDGVHIAGQVGDMRAINIALLGALARLMNLNPTQLRRIIKVKLPQKTLKANLTAFEKGREAMENDLKQHHTYRKRSAPDDV